MTALLAKAGHAGIVAVHTASWTSVVVLVAGMVCTTAIVVALIFATAERQETKR